MQSWQTDLLNLQLSLSVKPMFKYVGSIDRIRQMVSLGDGLMGKVAIPKGTERESVTLPGAEFEAEWIGVEGTDPERVVLYLPGGARCAAEVHRLEVPLDEPFPETAHCLSPDHPGRLPAVAAAQLP